MGGGVVCPTTHLTHLPWPGVPRTTTSEICGDEAGAYLRLIDFCITQLKDLLGPVNENEHEEEKVRSRTQPGSMK